MKYLWLVILLPIFVTAQSRKQRKAQEKADKELVVNLKLHVQNLLNLQNTANASAIPEYISAQFRVAGLAPDSTGNYIKNFTAVEGKFINKSSNIFTVNDSPLMLNEDYFPLAFTGNATAEGSASISMREKGSPWFLDIKDILEDNKNDHAFDIGLALKKQAEQIEERKATALIVYNSSATNDNIHFDKTDSTAALHVPVIYIKNAARKKYLKDATDFYDVKLTTELNNKQTSTQNIVGYINNNAAATVIVHTLFKHYAPYEIIDADSFKTNASDITATASLLELARIIKKSNLHNNNYVFIASPVRDSSFTGLTYWLENSNVNISPNYILDVRESAKNTDPKTYIISGSNSSEAWNDIIKASDKNSQLVFDSLEKNDLQFMLQKKNIPVLSVLISAPEQAATLNYDAEKEAVNFLARVIINTDAKGKIPFTAISAQP